MPKLDKRTVDEVVEFDSCVSNASMPTLLDTLIIGALRTGLNRLHKDHVRDVIVGEIFAARRACGMLPTQIVLYLDAGSRRWKTRRRCGQ